MAAAQPHHGAPASLDAADVWSPLLTAAPVRERTFELTPPDPDGGSPP